MRIKDKFINPFTDFGFKKLFGTEPNKDLLIDFLNELLRKDEGEITHINYLPTGQLGKKKYDRKAIFDIYCENKEGEKFIVEMQKAKQNYFKDRSIYYSTFPIQQQAERGEWDFNLKSVYTIGILDFVFDEDKDDDEVFHHEVQLFDKQTQKVFYDKLTYVYLEMPKFTKKVDELESHFDKWLFVLKNLELLTERPEKLQERIFKKLFAEAKIANYSDKEYAKYEESLKVYRDLKNSIDTAYSDGEKKGKEEGLKEGKGEGLKEGIKKGIEEGAKSKAYEIANAMKQKGIDQSTIIEILGLPVDETDQL